MFHIFAFYKFIPIESDRVGTLREEIAVFCRERGIIGLFLLATEGCNGTMAGAPEAMAQFMAYLQSLPEIGELAAKFSTSDFAPFDKLKVEIREEIVTLLRPDIVPAAEDNSHLSPTEWHQTLTSGEDFLLLDTRNTYETEAGKFRNVVDPQLTQFSDFPEFVKQQEIPKDKKILMYCTGGIRCEKALVYMKQEGYQNVFQLDGGILNYLEQYPNGEYEGECFVFDRRVAVDRELKPSQQYRICPHCGDPGKEKITCNHCGKEEIICRTCATVPKLHTCSKNCAYHFARLRGEIDQPLPRKQ